MRGRVSCLPNCPNHTTSNNRAPRVSARACPRIRHSPSPVTRSAADEDELDDAVSVANVRCGVTLRERGCGLTRAELAEGADRTAARSARATRWTPDMLINMTDFTGNKLVIGSPMSKQKIRLPSAGVRRRLPTMTAASLQASVGGSFLIKFILTKFEDGGVQGEALPEG